MENLLPIIIESGIKGLIVLAMALTSAAVCVYLERKISAWIQNRVGPNRVGPFGMFQPFADVIKLNFKEDITPKAANKFYHRLAPFIAITVAISVYAVIPFADYVMIGGRQVFISVAPNVNIGFLFILAMTSVGVYAFTIAGWSSNNKYSLMGGLRSSAQMISYELSMGLALIGIALVAGSTNLNDVVKAQSGWHWNIIMQPLGFIIFLVSSFAETNRSPFDLPEAEPELVGGYNTEYSGMKFGMFFLAEYSNMTASSALIATLYLGGWQLPFNPALLGLEPGSIGLALAQFASFFLKLAFMIFFYIWVRWSIPRFRYDQLMRLGWNVLLPLAILNVALTAVFVYFLK